MASTISWTGKSGSWTDLTWTFITPPPVPPVAGQNVYFKDNFDANTYTVTYNLTTNLTYGSLTLGGVGASGAFDLSIGAYGSGTPSILTVSGATTVYDGAIILDGGSLVGVGAVGAAIYGAGTIEGFGTINLANGLYGSGGAYGNGTLEASGGLLDVTGSINNQLTVVIDSSTVSDLKIESNSTIGTVTALVLNNANQTLEIGSSATVTLGNSAAQDISGGNVVIDGGTLKDTAGISLDAGAKLGGYGAVTTGTTPATEFSGGGAVNASGGTLTFNQAVDPTGTTATNFNIGNGATLTFKGAVGSASVDPTITFNVAAGHSGFLSLTSTPNGQFYGTVQNFVNSDEIFVSGSSTLNTLSVSGTYVIVKDGGITIQKIDMGTSVAAADVRFGANNLILVTDAICFMAGTMIRTPDGEVAVETLLRGDLVLTSDGLARPVSWLGRQTISTRFADPLRTWPVRIKAGALAENVPARDLLLSPDHAVLVDGALIHAGALVNGASIVRETKVPEIFTYYHVELDDHSLVLAENAPAETFIDNVERLAFDNWAEHEALYPEGKAITELPYPRAKGRRQVPVYVRVQLAERAEIIGASTAAAMVA